jgi:hypothetical protein
MEIWKTSRLSPGFGEILTAIECTGKLQEMPVPGALSTNIQASNTEQPTLSIFRWFLAKAAT